MLQRKSENRSRLGPRFLAPLGIAVLAFSLWIAAPPARKAAAQDAVATAAPTPRRSRSAIRLNATPFSINSRGKTREERRAEAQKRRGGVPAEPAAVNAVQEAPPPQGASKERPAGGAGGATSVQGSTEPPSIQFPPDALEAVLRFSPSDVLATENEAFEAAVVLDNKSRQPVDRFRFAVEYDPRWLAFDGCDDAPIAGLLNAKLSLERAPGRAEFAGRFAKPLLDDQISLLILRFSAKNAAGKAGLKLGPTAEGAAAVYSGERNLLLNEQAGLAGLMSALVLIRPAAADADLEAALLEAGMDPPLREKNLNGWPVPPADAKIGATVTLSLQGPEISDLAVGDDFWVDLVLYNDEAAPIDSIGAVVEFDPAALQVIDEDAGNWISRGVNLWDGGLHDRYPFDVFRENSADNRAGAATYSMGRYQTSYPFPTGIFARVHFRAVAPARSTAVRLARSERPGAPMTFVRIYGNDRLAGDWNSERPPTAVLRIAPQTADAAR